MAAKQLTRSARLNWVPNPPDGVGRVGVASSAFAALKISLAQDEPTPGETTPGELLACALAGYLGMHLALRMQRQETPLRELAIDVEITITPWPEYIAQQIEFSVFGRLCDPGIIDEKAFAGEIEHALGSAVDSLGLQHRLTRLVDSRLL